MAPSDSFLEVEQNQSTAKPMYNTSILGKIIIVFLLIIHIYIGIIFVVECNCPSPEQKCWDETLDSMTLNLCYRNDELKNLTIIFLNETFFWTMGDIQVVKELLNSCLKPDTINCDNPNEPDNELSMTDCNYVIYFAYVTICFDLNSHIHHVYVEDNPVSIADFMHLVDIIQ